MTNAVKPKETTVAEKLDAIRLRVVVARDTLRSKGNMSDTYVLNQLDIIILRLMQVTQEIR